MFSLSLNPAHSALKPHPLLAHFSPARPVHLVRPPLSLAWVSESAPQLFLSTGFSTRQENDPGVILRHVMLLCGEHSWHILTHSRWSPCLQWCRRPDIRPHLLLLSLLFRCLQLCPSSTAACVLRASAPAVPLGVLRAPTFLRWHPVRKVHSEILPLLHLCPLLSPPLSFLSYFVLHSMNVSFTCLPGTLNHTWPIKGTLSIFWMGSQKFMGFQDGRQGNMCWICHCFEQNFL